MTGPDRTRPRAPRLAPAAALLALACSGSQAPTPQGSPQPAAPGAGGGPLTVCAVNYPLAWFAERIGGDLVRVELPLPATGDPALWSPPPEEVLRFQRADLILRNGAGYAAWMERASLPESRVVDTSRTFAERLIATQAVTHAHGPQGPHSHGAQAFTTWLDPILAIEQARAILAALVARRPADEAALDERFTALERDLGRLDAELHAAVALDNARPLLASHPVYQYLARRYDLALESVHWEPDELPDEEAWGASGALLVRHPAHWMLWEAEPLPAVAERLRALGVEPLVYDPCARPPASGDFLTVMRANAAALERAFR